MIAVALGVVAGIATVAVVSLVLYRHLTPPSPGSASAEQAASEMLPQDTSERDALFAEIERLGFQAVRNEIFAEEFELAELGGDARALSAFSGQLVLLNFWATWCPPCVEEMPSLQNLHDALEEDAFSVVAVNVQEDDATVEEFVHRLELEFPVLLDRNGTTTRRYAVRGLPTSYLIGPDGRVLAAKAGFHLWDQPGFADGFRRILELSS